jgi:hypothetical protein
LHAVAQLPHQSDVWVAKRLDIMLDRGWTERVATDFDVETTIMLCGTARPATRH